MQWSRLSAVLVVWALSTGGAWGEARSPLEPLEARFAQQFGEIAHLEAADVARELSASPGDMVIIDTRQPAEYAVSHLPGAKRVDPGSGLEAALATAGDVSGKTVVFYCTVGYRSSTLATRMQNALKAAGAKTIGNLRGGVLGWHNKGLPLVDDKGETSFVHPYSNAWAAYLSRSELARMSPRAAQ